MPLKIVVGLLSLLVAIVLYTIGTWTAFRTKTFSARTLAILWVAAFFDVLATTMMALQYGGLDLRPGTPMIHTVVALVAMAIMIGSVALATWAVSAHKLDVAAMVARWIPLPWALWVAVFVWGMMTRGAERMSG